MPISCLTWGHMTLRYSCVQREGGGGEGSSEPEHHPASLRAVIYLARFQFLTLSLYLSSSTPSTLSYLSASVGTYVLAQRLHPHRGDP